MSPPSLGMRIWSRRRQGCRSFIVSALVPWLIWIAWCGGSNGSSGLDVKMTFVKGVGARDDFSRGVRRSRRLSKRAEAQGVRPGSGGNGGNRGKKAEAKRLTVSMREAKSAEEFVNVLEEAVDGPIFNYFHASAAYTRLTMWKRRGELLVGDKTTLLLDRLNHRVKEMVAEDELNPQACANVLWSIAHLSDVLTNALDVVPAMAAQIPLKAKDLGSRKASPIFCGHRPT